MKQGSPRLTSHGGFTIVETLIVLAVTGMLFLAIVATLGGRQGKNQFTQAINDVKSQIQQIITETQNGYYQNNSDFHCSSTGGTPSIISGTSEQGSNANGTTSGCVFLGKAIQFGVQGTNPEEYSIFSLAGYIGAKGATPQAALTAAHVTPIYKTVANPGAPTDNIEHKILLNGLTTGSMAYNNGGADIPIGAVAFVMELGSLDSSNNYTSGTQPIDLIPVPISGGGLNQTNADAAAALSPLNPALMNPTGGVKICFVSGASQESGLITIGGNGGHLTVDLQRKSNRTCS